MLFLLYRLQELLACGDCISTHLFIYYYLKYKMPCMDIFIEVSYPFLIIFQCFNYHIKSTHGYIELGAGNIFKPIHKLGK